MAAGKRYTNPVERLRRWCKDGGYDFRYSVEPDADLIRLGRAYDAAFRAARNPRLNDDEARAAARKLARIEFEIQDTPAASLSGLIVKARVAKKGGYCAPFREERALEGILPSLIDDILRLRAAAG